MKRFALKRLTALVLAFIMTLSLLPMNVWAEELQENAEEQVIVAAEEKEESPAEVAEEPAEDSSAVVEESAEEPVVEEEETESGEAEDVSASAVVSAPLANSAASAYEACWGLATGTDNTGKPTSWTVGGLNDAMTYANGLESGTAYIQLRSDVDTTAPLEFASGKTTILDLNGFDIDHGLTEATSNGKGSVIYVWGNLTLCDTSENAETDPGKITGGYTNARNEGGGVYVRYGSTFTMEGGSISDNDGLGVYVVGTFTMEGGSISDNEYHGVYVYSGPFTMEGGSISNNAGGGVFVYDGTFTMEGGSISNNTARNYGAGVYVRDGSFTMKAGSISDNTASGNYGGGVYVDYGSFTMEGGSISDNTAKNYGAGVYGHYGSTFTMEGGSISDNDGNGVDANGTFTMEGGSISGNYGRGVCADGTFTMEGGSISGNRARYSSGDGVCVDGTFTMEGGSISDNAGRGVYVYKGGTFTMENGSISDNASGGVYAYGTFTMKAGSISGNEAYNYGGGVYVASGTFRMKGGSISDNTAGNDGGGVYFRSGTFSVSGEPVINNNKKGTGASVTENNVYLPGGEIITIDGALGSSALIGITMEGNTGVFAQPDGKNITDTSDYIGNFSSDNTYFVAAYREGNLKLVLSHPARWGLATGTNSDEQPTTWANGTLSEAMTYANGLASGTAYIQLRDDVNTTAPLEFASGKTTILDLNGKTIDRGLTEATANGNVIIVNGKLTLCDTSTNATTAPGKITGGYSDYSGGGVSVCQDGAFAMTGGAIVENHAACDGGGVHVRASSFTMTGGTIAGNTAAMGGGVFVTNNFGYKPGHTLVFKRGAFAMTGGTISENTATSVSNDYSFNYGGYGGGVYLEGSDFSITNGTISNNTASDAGGGVFVGSFHYDETNY